MTNKNWPNNRLIFTLILLAVLPALCSAPLLKAATPDIKTDPMTPVGTWHTIDDNTNKVRSVVKIWQHHDGTLKGRIEKIFPKPGEPENPLCDKCKGHLKNKPVIGMEFMWGFQGKTTEWENGKILDPENGKIYNCRLTVAENGKKLKVYGYIKVIFKIGRTQTWIRNENTETE